MTGYRKLLAATAALGLSTALLVFHFLSGSEWVAFNTAQLGLFFGANSVSKLWGRGSEKAKPSTPA